MSATDDAAHGDAHDRSVATGVTDDAFLGGALSILQPAAGYRAGLDAVILAAAARVPARSAGPVRVGDFGAGVGTAALCLARRRPDISLELIERDAGLVALAEQNLARNGLADRARVIAADVFAKPFDPRLGPERYDAIITNPPYHRSGDVRAPRDPARSAAHVMTGGTLDDWMRAAARVMRPGGDLTLVHRADALGDLLAAMAGRFGDVRVVPVYPRRDSEAAHRVLIAGTKGSRAPLSLRAPLTLHQGDGHGFSDAVSPALQGVAAIRVFDSASEQK